MRYLWFFILLSLLLLGVVFLLGCPNGLPLTDVVEPLKSREGKFKLDVRTADDNAQIDYYNANSDVPAFWEKLGEKELEIFLWSVDEWENLYLRPEFNISISVEYGDYHWDVLREVFEQDFIDGKYKDYTIVRAWDERGLLSDFGIVPPILNQPYREHAAWQHVFAIHTTWWRVWFPGNDVIFEGENFVERYYSIADDLERARYWDSFKESFVLTYADGEVKRDAAFSFALTDNGLAFSIACDRGQSVSVKIDGTFPEPHKSFMVRDAADFEIFSPGDPEGASINFN